MRTSSSLPDPPKNSTGRAITLGLFLLVAGFLAYHYLAPQIANRMQEAETPLATLPDIEPAFAELTAWPGQDAVYDPAPPQPYYFPRVMGPGLCVIDLENDGDLDLVLPNRVLKRLDNGSLADVTAESGLVFEPWVMGFAVGDVTNDGLDDLYTSGLSGGRMFINQGNGTFTDQTEAMGLADDQGWGTSAAFCDYDRDGWLDLFVANYVDYEAELDLHEGPDADFLFPSAFDQTHGKLFHHLGGKSETGPRFEDVSRAAGLTQANGYGLGVIFVDTNLDKLADIFVTCDTTPNLLWRNSVTRRFREAAGPLNLALNRDGGASAGMGVALADIDADLKPEIIITNFGSEVNTVRKLQYDNPANDLTLTCGLAEASLPMTGFGVAWLDFDNDGDLDLAVANGRVVRPHGQSQLASMKEQASPGTTAFWAAYSEPNQLFRNNGQGKFTQVGKQSPFCSLKEVSRGLIAADLNNDGRVDLAVSNLGGLQHIFLNETETSGHWLSVQTALPEQGGRSALSAMVTLVCGNKKFRGWVLPGQSYLSSGDPRVHFGLGEITQVDEIIVSWPAGQSESFTCGAVDRQIRVEMGKGKTITQE